MKIRGVALRLVESVYGDIPELNKVGVVNAIHVFCAEFPEFRPERDFYLAKLRGGHQISFGIKGGGKGAPLFGLVIRKSRPGESVLVLRFDDKKDAEELLLAWGVRVDGQDIKEVWKRFRGRDEVTFELSELARDTARLRDLIKKLKSRVPGVLIKRMGWAPDIDSKKKYNRKVDSAGRSTMVGDLSDLSRNKNYNATEREALIAARVGQGDFRKRVLKRWGGRCAVTGANLLGAIRASHIKPWKESNDEERLLVDNGIPLVATLDALFDSYLISFNDDGGILISSVIDAGNCRQLGISTEMRLREPCGARQAEFLCLHRTQFEMLQKKRV